MQRFAAPPEVDIEVTVRPLDLDPASTRAALRRFVQQQVNPGWPLPVPGAAGLYLLRLVPDGAGRTAMKLLNVAPPSYKDDDRGDQMSESGRIDLRVEDDSMFLSNNLPYVIRKRGTQSSPVGRHNKASLTRCQRVSTPLRDDSAGPRADRACTCNCRRADPLVVTEDGVRVDAPTSPRP